MDDPMMMPVRTALYAGLAAVLFLGLSIYVIAGRMRGRVSLGQGDEALMRRVRAHANFAEYVPLVLILMALAEGTGQAGWLVHAMGVALIVGRLAHAWSMATNFLPARQLGMSLTFLALIISAVLAFATATGVRV